MTVKFDHLLGRPYRVGVDHCLKLVRDFYADNFGTIIRDYAVPVNWNANDLNLIEMIYEREGFEKVTDWSLKSLRPGDLLAVAVRSRNPNHFCIYLGGNEILHHPLGELSRVEPLRDFWRMSTCYVLRHPNTPDLSSVLPTTTIKDLLDARYSVQAEA